jgi:hypothetical protein
VAAAPPALAQVAPPEEAVAAAPPALAQVAPPEEAVAAAPKAAAPPALAPAAPPEEAVAAAPKAAASPPLTPVATPEEAVGAAPPALAPVAPPEEPETAAPNPAELQPAASSPVVAVARALAVALVALEEKHAPGRERSAIASAVSLPRANYQTPGESPADRPPFVRRVTNSSGQAAKEKPELARASPLQLTTGTAASDTGIAGHGHEHRAMKSPAAVPEPGRFAPTAHRAALYRPKAAEPEGDESPKVAPFGGDTVVEARRFRRRTGMLAHYVEDGEPPPRSHEIGELSYRRPRRSLFVGGALLAVVLAAGLTYVMIQSENPVAMPPTDAADPAKIVPAATPADTDDKMAAAPSSDAPASADHPATDLAAEGDDSGQTSPKKVRTLVVGPPMPVVSSKAASDGSAGQPPPGASPAVPPSADDGGAADASSDAPSGETQMEAIINNKGVPITVNVDPLATSGGANKAAADAAAVPTRGPLPAPVGVSASDASGATASDNGAAAADDASPVPAAPARVPIPRPKPTIPDKASEPLPTPPAATPTGDLY